MTDSVKFEVFIACVDGLLTADEETVADDNFILSTAETCDATVEKTCFCCGGIDSVMDWLAIGDCLAGKKEGNWDLDGEKMDESDLVPTFWPSWLAFCIWNNILICFKDFWCAEI